MHFFKVIGLSFARVCISALFILSAVLKIIDWQATERALVSLLCDWHAYMHHTANLQKFFANILPWAPAILITATVFELLGGLLLLLGIKPRLGAWLLIIFFIPATVLLHPFWFVEGIKKELQVLMFIKNIAIFGGLLMIVTMGGKIAKNHHAKDNAQE